MTKTSAKIVVRGFTLIELLVVISIIALLVAILMPALGKARQAARQVACMAQSNSIGKGLMNYTTENDDWLAGPNTSGIRLGDNSADPGDCERSTAPVQNMDWFSPLMGRELVLPKDRLQRIMSISNNSFRCPENNVKYDYIYPDNADKLELTYVNSYCATLGFHLKKAGEQGANEIGNSKMMTQVDLPEGYQPKLSRVGKPVEKIFSLDGTRYLNYLDGRYQISYNTFIKQIEGGNYMCYGPVNTFAGDPFKLDNFADPKIVEGTEKYSFRHNKRLNAIFFDGHCESLDLKSSLKTSLYWPRGSVINNAAATFDPTDYKGQLIK